MLTANEARKISDGSSIPTIEGKIREGAAKGMTQIRVDAI